MIVETRKNYNPKILSRAGLQNSSHVHTTKIASVARVKCPRCGVLFTTPVAYKGIAIACKRNPLTKNTDDPLIFEEVHHKNFLDLRTYSCHSLGVHQEEEEEEDWDIDDPISSFLQLVVGIANVWECADLPFPLAGSKRQGGELIV